MGYFANGTEGDMYEERYCSRCHHDDPEHGVFCPILALHVEHNYGASKEVRAVLDSLIPRSKDGLTNEECVYFKDAPERDEDDEPSPAERVARGEYGGPHAKEPR